MTQPAARISDFHMCPMVTPGVPPIPHVGGPILPPGAPTVLIGGLPAARVGDMAVCVGPPDSIVKGAFPVLMGGQPAARMTDSTAHGGMVMAGCPTVLVGLAGTSGNPWAGGQACTAAAAGRNPPPGATAPNGAQLQPGTPGQSYNNCGCESARQIVNQATPLNVSQEGLLNWATSTPNPAAAAQGLPFQTMANGVPGNMWASGGTFPSGQSSMLSTLGVPSQNMAPTMSSMQLATAQGRGVIANLDAAQLPRWAGTPSPAGHAVLVTGFKYDANGNVTHAIINDTGQGTCADEVPIAAFQNAINGINPPFNMTVTNNPIW